MLGTCPLAGVVPSPRAIRFIVTCKLSTSRHVVKLLVGELFLLFVVFWFHNRNVLKLMIELISAAKVGKISETDVSLPEKVVSNQEKCVRNMSRGRLYRLELVL